LIALLRLHLLPVNYAGLALMLLGIAFMIGEAFIARLRARSDGDNAEQPSAPVGFDFGDRRAAVCSLPVFLFSSKGPADPGDENRLP